MIQCGKFLDQEEEFVKLSEELDMEARTLLQQFDHVLVNNKNRAQQSEMDQGNGEKKLNRKATSAAIERSKREKVESILPIPTIGANFSQPKLTRHKSEIGIRDRLDGNLVPDSVKNMGQDGVVRFLKAKVQILSEQLENVQKDEKKLMEKVKELESDRERVSEDRDKWIQQANIAKSILMKHEQHASDVVIQLQNTQAENGYLKKEVEKLKKELKQLSQGAGSSEVRLNRAHEEVEKLKVNLRRMKQEEKDLREAQKKKLEEMSAGFKRIEKQKMELFHAFKKQLLVIDGLKKQRGLAEAGKMLKTIEDDFMEFLDWNPKKC